MAPVLTLHQGDAQAEYVEHPIETARRALYAAAELEAAQWSDVMKRMASSLPNRGSLVLAGHCQRFADALPHRDPIRKED